MPQSQRGTHSKAKSIFDDLNAMDPAKLKKFMHGELDGDTAQKYGKHLTSHEMPRGLLKYIKETVLPRLQHKRAGKGFSLATMRRVMIREGFRFTEPKKAVYYDGHERPDVVADRNDCFLAAMQAIRSKLIRFEGGNVTKRIEPTSDDPNFKPHILCSHDEMTTQAHDGKKASWVLDGEQPLLKKGQGRGHHSSEWLNSVDGHMPEAGQGMDYGKNHEGW
ncbi:hypothetical protein C8F01DRAFT_1252777 [Mycena amicta]|nr:hypothetical protein C8F01DRAFT_1252777 [Mycena amicta]